MEVWQESSLSLPLKTEDMPVQKHSMHQPQKPHSRKLVPRQRFKWSLLSGNAQSGRANSILLSICRERPGYTISGKDDRILEIERKFLIRKMPENLGSYECKVIEQGYLCSRPVVRIRRSNDEYYLTYKSRMDLQGKGESCALECEEIEVPLTREAYEHLRTKIDDYPIRKRRYLIPLEQGLKAELDIFEGALTGLYFAEVEFPDRRAAEEFRKPAWFGEDVSFDKRYKNNYLSRLEDLSEFERES